MENFINNSFNLCLVGLRLHLNLVSFLCISETFNLSHLNSQKYAVSSIYVKKKPPKNPFRSNQFTSNKNESELSGHAGKNKLPKTAIITNNMCEKLTKKENFLEYFFAFKYSMFKFAC